MLVDLASVSLRIVSFVALFQASGAAIFVALFGKSLAQSLPRIRHVGLVSAFVALASVGGHYALEAARMAGDFTGVMDASLQTLVMRGSSGAMAGARLAGVLLIALGLAGDRDWRNLVALLGTLFVLVSFTLVGHTAVHPDRPILAALLIAHLFGGAFWFGALAPLYLVSSHEPMRIAGRVLNAFSSLALWLVPGLMLAGVLIATFLIPSLEVFKSSYGILLIGKAVGFSLLMLLASANKWRFAPAINHGEARAITLLQRSLIAEYVLIVAVLGITAVMTEFFAPDS